MVKTELSVRPGAIGGELERFGIIGGFGFLGQSFSLAASKGGHEIVHLPRFRMTGASGGKKYCSPVENYADHITETGVSTIVNFAWSGLPDYGPLNTGRNARLTTLIHEAWAQSAAACFVGMGSCLEYGQANGAIHEETSPASPSFFGATKSWLYDHLQETANAEAKRIIWVRPFWLIGSGQRSTSLVPSILKSFSEGVREQPKNPHVVLDFIDIDDFSQAVIEVVLAKSTSGAFNIGSGLPHSTQEVAEIAYSVAEGKSHQWPSTEDRPSGGGTWSSNRKIAATTGWRPATPLHESIRKVWMDLPK